jgi:membrane protease YdiL (CAAX protease family)
MEGTVAPLGSQGWCRRMRWPLTWGAVLAGPMGWLILREFLPAQGIGVTGEDMLARVFMLAVVYPLLEELVFRGALQQYLRGCTRGWFGPVSTGNLLATVCFCAAHGVARGSSVAALVFVPSLVFGILRDAHGRVAPAFLLHAYYNSGFFVLFGLPP